MPEEEDNQSDDDFKEIINYNQMQDFMSPSDPSLMTVRDLHTGLKFMTEAVMHLTTFLEEFYIAVSEDRGDERPGLSLESIIFLKNIFENCQEFCVSSMISEIDDEEDDDVDYDEEDDDEEDDEEDE